MRFVQHAAGPRHLACVCPACTLGTSPSLRCGSVRKTNHPRFAGGPYTHAPYGPDGDTAHTRSNHNPPARRHTAPRATARSPRKCNGGEKRVRKSHRPNFRCQCPLKFRGCAQDVALSAPVRCKSREWTAALRAREEICSPPASVSAFKNATGLSPKIWAVRPESPFLSEYPL